MAALPAAFALNHVTTPYADFTELAAIVGELGVSAVELRNDLDGVPLADGSDPVALAAEAREAGLAILNINALQRFDAWSPARAREACALATLAVEVGAGALVLCPVNDVADARDEIGKARDLRAALAGLMPILSGHGLTGLVEPLGFATSSLRLKRDALAAIGDVGGEAVFGLLHDSFHHAISGETETFAQATRLVHVSGVLDPVVAIADMRDHHRELVLPGDRLETIEQLRALRQGGYAGPLSVEDFAASVHDDPDRIAALRRSLEHMAASC